MIRNSYGAVAMEVIVLGGGCYWGVQELMRRIGGVTKTEVGFAGGFTENPHYDQVKLGKTGHAESVRVTFDPSKVSLEHLLEHFFKLHDPTTLNRQVGDVGTQYRSAIFYSSPEQEKLARSKIAAVEATGFWKAKIVTEVVPLKKFYLAHDEHQDFLQKDKEGYNCHYYRAPVAQPVRADGS